MYNTDSQPIPTLAQLGRATLLALVVAAILLVVAVLPAEYNIDPTGIGGAMGLTSLANADATEEVVEVIPGEGSQSAVTLLPQNAAYMNEQRTITLEAFEGIELKAAMTEGQSFSFSWASENGPVFVDMHGEPPNAGDNEFTSYWKEKAQEKASGVFVAPFAGTHGWYWQNMGEEPVTIQIAVSGFFEKLYIP